MQDGQAAHARVEHADRPRIHRAIVEAATLPGRGSLVPGGSVCVRVRAVRRWPRVGITRRATPRSRWTTASSSRRRCTSPTARRRRRAGPAIVLFHGLGSDRQSLDSIAKGWANTFAVLSFDARGHGESQGLSSLDGPREIADTREVFDWLAARPEIDRNRIGAWGISLGGGAVLRSLGLGVPWAAVEVGRDLDEPLQRARAAEPDQVGRDLQLPERPPAGPARPVGAGDQGRRAREQEPRRAAPLGEGALERLAALEGDEAGLLLPGPARLRVRHRPGAQRLQARQGPEAPLHRRLRPLAVHVPRARHQAGARRRHALVLALPARGSDEPAPLPVLALARPVARKGAARSRPRRRRPA